MRRACFVSKNQSYDFLVTWWKLESKWWTFCKKDVIVLSSSIGINWSIPDPDGKSIFRVFIAACLTEFQIRFGDGIFVASLIFRQAAAMARLFKYFGWDLSKIQGCCWTCSTIAILVFLRSILCDAFSCASFSRAAFFSSFSVFLALSPASSGLVGSVVACCSPL